MTAEQARSAVRLAEADPEHARRLAGQALRDAEAEHDLGAASVAERAMGLAALQVSDLDLALRHSRRAVQLAARAGDQRLAAEARMSLAGVLSRRGQARAALGAIDKTLTVLTGADHARATAQRGAIMHQIGRLDEALRSYQAAMPGLRRAADLVWMQRILANRAVLHAQRNEFTAALDDLRAAEDLCRKTDMHLSLAYVHQNLGFVHACRGDSVTALRYLGEAEAQLRALGCSVGEVLVDRAELLLSLRLATEARQAAAEAVAVFEQETPGVALPEARLVLARAALLDGSVAEATDQATKAVAELTRQRRLEWVALGRIALLSCELAGAISPKIGTAALRRLADTAAAAWPAAAAYADVTAARLAADRGQQTLSRRLLADAARRRRRGPVIARTLAWQATALLRLGEGNDVGATRAARAGLRLLDEHVGALGATDLRASAAGNRVELAAIGLRIALRSRRPRQVFHWAELGRASHLLHPPARPPVDGPLAELTTELRATMVAIARATRDGRAPGRHRHRQVTLERSIRDRHRTRAALGQRRDLRPPTIEETADAVAAAAFLEFVQLDGELSVLSVVNGRVRMHRVGPMGAVDTLVHKLLFAMRRISRERLGSAALESARALFDHATQELSSVLLGVAPEIADQALVVVPTGSLQQLPWAMLPVCAGRPVTIAPSAALYVAASKRNWCAAERVTVVAGPELPGSRAEADAIASLYGVLPLVDAAAEVDQVAKALDGTRIAHLATHGTLRADNPSFSSLRMTDGPLMAYDLEDVPRLPETMVLAACDAGRAVVRPGDEILGFAATLLAHGAQRLVAPVIAIHDVDTVPLMVAFHGMLKAGKAPAEALATAQQRAAADNPAGAPAIARFVCIGS